MRSSTTSFEVPPDIARITRLTDFNISHLADNVILLEYDWSGDQVQRALTLLKARTSPHQPSQIPFEITSHGIVIGR